jgi:hypothetical protein
MMAPSDREAHERLLVHDEFWQMFLPLFYNEETVQEFSEITGLPEQRIRAARDRYFDQNVAPHLHSNNGTVH